MWYGFEEREVKRPELPPEMPPEVQGVLYGLLWGLILFGDAIAVWLS